MVSISTVVAVVSITLLAVSLVFFVLPTVFGPKESGDSVTFHFQNSNSTVLFGVQDVKKNENTC